MGLIRFFNFITAFSFSHILFCAAVWTTILLVAVGVTSFVPEFTFIFAVHPSSFPSKAYCGDEGSVKLPLDIPQENFCFSTQLIRASKLDALVPPIVSAVVVVGAAFLLSGVGLGEDAFEEDELV